MIFPTLWFGGAMDTSPETAGTPATDTNGYTLTVVYSGPLDETSGTTLSQWTATDTTLHSAHRTQSPTSRSISGSTLTMKFANPVFDGGTVTLSYTAGAVPLKDAAGNNVADLSSVSVTNNGVIPAPLMWINLLRSTDFTTSSGLIDSLINAVSATSYATAGAAKPSYSATGLDGTYPGATGDTVNKQMIGTLEAGLAAALSTTDSPYTMAYVLEPGTPDRSATTVDFYSAGPAMLRFRSSSAANGVWSSVKTDDASVSGTATRSADIVDALQLVVWHSSGTAASCQVNNAAADPSDAAQNVGAGNITTVSFFANEGGTQTSDATVGWWGYWNVRLDSTQLTALNAWAAETWAI